MPENGELTIVVFRLADQSFGLPVTAVGQIIEMVLPVYLPQLPPFVPGIIDYHGQLVPLIDVRLRFGLPFRPYDLYTPVILTQVNDRFLGLIVDAVADVVTVLPQQIQAVALVLPAELAQLADLPIPELYLDSLARLADQSMLPVLAVDRLLTMQEKALLQEAVMEGKAA